MNKKLYPIHDELAQSAGIHCTALAIAQNFSQTPYGMPVVAQPDASLRNGMLTFIRSGERTFGITCQHVVEHYRTVVTTSGAPGNYSMLTMLNGFLAIQDRFVQPRSQFGQERPDVAIRELHPGFASHLGKKCIDLDKMIEPPGTIRHAYAVGFPENLKRNKVVGSIGHRVSMPQVEILAEIGSCPDRRFTMRSDLPAASIAQDFSGMSGGPIFWSTEDEYGILGIIYEGGLGKNGSSIYVFGELATPEIIRCWLEDVPTIY